MGEVIDFQKYRQDNNQRVLEKMKNGDNLSTSTLQDSWYPSKGKFDRSKGRMMPAEAPVPPPPNQPTLDENAQRARQMVDVFKAGIAPLAEDATVGVTKRDLAGLLFFLEIYLPK